MTSWNDRSLIGLGDPTLSIRDSHNKEVSDRRSNNSSVKKDNQMSRNSNIYHEDILDAAEMKEDESMELLSTMKKHECQLAPDYDRLFLRESPLPPTSISPRNQPCGINIMDHSNKTSTPPFNLSNSLVLNSRTISKPENIVTVIKQSGHDPKLQKGASAASVTQKNQTTPQPRINVVTPAKPAPASQTVTQPPRGISQQPVKVVQQAVPAQTQTKNVEQPIQQAVPAQPKNAQQVTLAQTQTKNVQQPIQQAVPAQPKNVQQVTLAQPQKEVATNSKALEPVISKKALLIAVCNSQNTSLIAPEYDVLLMRQLLLKCGYTDSQIIVLSDKNQVDSSKMPTLQNIKQHLAGAKELTIYISGHGATSDNKELPLREIIALSEKNKVRIIFDTFVCPKIDLPGLLVKEQLNCKNGGNHNIIVLRSVVESKVLNSIEKRYINQTSPFTRHLVTIISEKNIKTTWEQLVIILRHIMAQENRDMVPALYFSTSKDISSQIDL